jgi:hypothetical protein
MFDNFFVSLPVAEEYKIWPKNAHRFFSASLNLYSAVRVRMEALACFFANAALPAVLFSSLKLAD